MTALGAGTVERTFSAVGRYSAGLPGPKTHEAGGQDLGDFGEALGWVFVVCTDSHCCRLNEKFGMSSVLNSIAKWNGFLGTR